MKFRKKLLRTSLLIAGTFLLLSSGCKSVFLSPSEAETQTPAITITPVIEPSISPTPTEISGPMAAIVNGEGIPLDFFESEVARYKLAMQNLGVELPAEEVIIETVLNDLIEQVLLSQAAREGGYELTDALIAERTTNLAEEMGGQAVLDEWMVAQGYTSQQFETSMRLSIGAAWQRNAIIETVTEAVEQVHARQIFARTEAGANRAFTSLNSGADFDDLAWEFNPETGGELGWFPRGYLTVPQVEEAAFTLPVGQYSEIIASELGYHIVMVIERSDSRLLTTDALQTLQRQALSDWITAAVDQAQFEVLVP